MIFGRLTGCSFKQLFSVACCIFFSVSALCQEKEPDFKFGNVNAKDFDVSSSKIVSPDDGAVILYESGSTHFVGNDKRWFNYVYTCTRRIKILDKRAFDLASIRLRLYKNDDLAEVVSDIKANTYNLNNGVVSSVNMDKNSIFTEQDGDNHLLKKFALPAVQENSIIEYSYTITSPFDFNMPSWQFQSAEYPVLWSEYQASIPSVLNYTLIKQGVDSFFINKMWEGKQNYRVSKGGITTGQSDDLIVSTSALNYRWAEKDVLPLKVESYISTPENYVSRISFQLAGTYNGEEKSEVVNTWEAASGFFLDREDFKQATSYDNTWIKDIPGLSENADDVQKAKAIYSYVQSSNVCTNASNIFTDTDLYDVYKQQKGTVRGINLLLIAILNNKGIHAEPVILSTRDNGFVNPNYPVIDNFNYLICRAKIGDKTYLLDATDPILGFGELSAKCYNGYARVLNEKHPDSLYLFTDSLNESDVSTLTLNNDESGKIAGSYVYTMGQIKSAAFRRDMLLTTNQEEYFKEVKKSYLSDVDITNSKIDSLEQKGMPVSVQYDLNFKMNDDIAYFNPIAGSDIQKENPFKAAERVLPVEMPYCMNKTYILNMQVPTGYKVDELPKSARVALNDNEGMFQYLVQQTDDRIQLVCKLKLNKANFEPDDYETLRNFFAFVVEKESEQIVFKKI